MLTRGYGVALGIAIALIAVAAMTAQSAPAADAGRETASDANREWLTLDWIGGLPPAGEHLTVYADGKVRLVLESPRANWYIGTFESQLSPRRLAALRKAVQQADVYSLRDTYRPGAGTYDYTTMTISIVTERGRKQVQATATSSGYPERLKRLFDLTDGLVENGGNYPGGILSRLISDVSAKPVSAISVRIDVPAGPIRAGSQIVVGLVVQNVGTTPVLLPSPECDDIVSGNIYVNLRHSPPPVAELVTPLDTTGLMFGNWSAPHRETLTDRARADLAHLVRIEPGNGFRFAMRKPLVAPSPGQYELISFFWLNRVYDRAVLTREVGDGFVSGYTSPAPVRLTVSR